MKQKAYLRITKDGKIDASGKFKGEPLRDSNNRAKPTVFLALELNIPDEAFQPPSISASITVPIEKLGTCIETVDPMKVL
jgi:hypothetical protein